MVLSLNGDPKNICILRLSAVGDVCHTVPVVRALQDHWPAARLTWVIGKLESTLVGDLPGVNFLVLDKSRGWRAYRDLKRDLQGKTFDLLLHMQVSLRSSLASRLISSPVRLGFDRERARDLQWLFTTHRIAARKHQHVMDGLLGFAHALCIPDPAVRWDIPIPDRARQFAARHVESGRKTLIISPCSTSRYRNWRNWRPDAYAAVADHAAQKHGMQVILTGGTTKKEARYGNDICRIAAHGPNNLIGKTGLKELLALLDRADVLVAPDSGPVHMATTVGTPVIGLYATSNPMRTGPYYNREWVVNKYPEALEAELGKRVDEVPWGKRVRNPAAVDRIRVTDVTDKLDALLTSD